MAEVNRAQAAATAETGAILLRDLLAERISSAERRIRDLEAEYVQLNGSETPETDATRQRKVEIQGQLRAERDMRETDMRNHANHEKDVGTAHATREAATIAAGQLRSEADTRRRLAAQLADAGVATQQSVTELTTEADKKEAIATQLAADQKALKDEEAARRGIPKRFLLPVVSQRSAELFFGQAGEGLLQNVTISMAGDAGAGSLSAELVSEIAGPIRFSATTVVARATGEEAIDASDPSSIERFFAGGGTLVVSAAMPLAFAARSNSSFVMQAHWKVAGDMAEGGRVLKVEEYPANADLGFESYGLVATPLRRFQFYWFARWGFVLGSDEFYNNLGYGGQRGFGYVQWTAGLRLGENISIVATASDGPYRMNREPTLTFQLSPAGAF